ncbi:MAG: cytochrome c biogenesis CcdA family protein [Chloroflexota bacterium]
MFIAFGAGIFSFLSPCTLPLIPGYLSYISGLTSDEIQSGRNTAVLLRGAILFVLGFSLVFVALGATASYIGSELQLYKDAATRVAGVFIIVMALVMLGVFRIPMLYREKRFHVSPELGMWGAFPLGMAFAFGWTPCIGPVLSGVFTLAMSETSVRRGSLLLFVYALGLGVPFLAVALFAGRAVGTLNRFKRHYTVINGIGGSVLLVMGVFLVLNRWTELLSPVMNWYADLNIHV